MGDQAGEGYPLPRVTLHSSLSLSQGSGGLVSCVDPVMSKHEDNVWLANLGMVSDKETFSTGEEIGKTD